MTTLAETLSPLFDQAIVGRMCQQLGVDEQTTRRTIQVSLPLLVTALDRNSASPQGAQARSEAVVRDHDGSVLRHLPDAVANYQAEPGDGILRHVLGAQRQLGQQNRDVMAVIGTLLDTNKDGSMVDDVIGLARRLFGRRP
jgi:hypothetical protein